MKYRVFIWWSIIIFMIWVISGFLMTWFWGMNNRGTAGDMFGAINALFSGLAFAGIIYTIAIQREELKLQREELRLQREEVAKSREELAGQKENMILQRFETTFFNLISAYAEISSSVTNGGSMKGREIFEDLSLQLDEEFNSEKINKQSVLGHLNYIRGLELCYDNFIFILQFIHNQPFSQEEKRNYSDIFKAQFPKSQISVMKYYASFKEISVDHNGLSVQHDLALMKASGM